MHDHSLAYNTKYAVISTDLIHFETSLPDHRGNHADCFGHDFDELFFLHRRTTVFAVGLVVAWTQNVITFWAISNSIHLVLEIKYVLWV